MIRKYFNLFFISLVLFGLAPEVLAMGLGVSPTSLTIATNHQGLAKTELVISNPSAEVGLFTIAADEYADWFVFQPAELRLDPKSQQRVNLIIKPNKVGRYASNLSILAYPLDNRSFNAASGIKVPFNLTVVNLPTSQWQYYLGWGLLLLALAGAVGLIYYYQKKTAWWQKLLKRLGLI
ncbi:hypothetical protein KKC17_01625 [Patescibacteria group bacterium]|nr:hypothetical protein [Patescibacteria group bacterium]